MGKCLVSSTITPLKLCQKSRSILPFNPPKQNFQPEFSAKFQSLRGFQHGRDRNLYLIAKPIRTLCTKAVLSEIPNQKQFAKIGAGSTGSIPSDQLLHVVETAAKTGAEVVMEAVNRPRNITYKGLTDLVTESVLDL